MRLRYECTTANQTTTQRHTSQLNTTRHNKAKREGRPHEPEWRLSRRRSTSTSQDSLHAERNSDHGHRKGSREGVGCRERTVHSGDESGCTGIQLLVDVDLRADVAHCHHNTSHKHMANKREAKQGKGSSIPAFQVMLYAAPIDHTAPPAGAVTLSDYQRRAAQQSSTK
jgi:hypothetical protein